MSLVKSTYRKTTLSCIATQHVAFRGKWCRIPVLFACFVLSLLNALPGWSQTVPDFPASGQSDIVGKTEDRFEVTPSGQVSYEIAIKVPTGTGGMEPKLSISYNGSRRNGLCGIGFDLTGLSVINRAPANMHVDGRAGTVEVSSDDCLMLDGQRLIQVANLGDGRKEWRTEQDSYSRIISQEVGVLGIYSFHVQTKSGLTYYYDASSSPHADRDNPGGTSQPHFLFWLLKKVEDTSGNYYTVTYGTDHRRGEYWPERVDYTYHGNTQTPYASVRFDYATNPDSTVTYIGGLRVRNCHLLTSVKAYYGEELVKRYDLAYQSVNNHRQLVSVTEHGLDGSSLRPTVFGWHNTPGEPGGQVNVGGMDQLVGAKLVTGDFNGDGVTDVFAYAEDDDNDWSGWRVFLGDGAGMTQAASGSFNYALQTPKQVLSVDINGDGLDDIIVKKEGKHYSWGTTTYRDMEIYLSGITFLGQYGLSYHTCAYSSTDNFTLYPAKVSTSSQGYANASVLMTFDGTKNGRLWHGITDYTAFTSPKDWGTVYLGDFDGDGLTDIANRVGSYLYFLTTDGTGMQYQAVDGRHDVGGEFIYTGDFNGDGKTDLFRINGYGAQTVEYSTGSFLFSSEFLDATGWLPSGFQYQMRLCDLDGDGRDDAFRQTVQQRANYSEPQAYYNRNDGKLFVASAANIGYGQNQLDQIAGDFNGDGKVDLMRKSTKDSDGQSCAISYSPLGSNNLLASVTDGLGNTTSIEYKCMTDTAVYTRGTVNTDSVGSPPYSRSLSAAWPLVSRVTVPDGIGGTRSTTYRYHNALLHKRGRGVMGFEQTTVLDEATATETVTHYKVHPQEFVMTPDWQTVRVGDRLVEETEMTDTLVYHYSHVFSVQPKESTTWKYEYNTGELVAQTTTRQQFDSHGNVTRLETVTPYKTEVNVNTYADDTTLGASSRWLLGRLVSAEVTKSDGTATQTLRSTFEYDAATGLLVRESIEPDDPQLGSSKAYTRDAFGNIVRSVHRTNAATSQQRVTRTLYDDKGRLITATVNALGDTVRTVHDPLLCVPLMTVGANNDTTLYRYDGMGNLLRRCTAIDTVSTAMMFDPAACHPDERGMHYVFSRRTGEPPGVKYCDTFGRALWTATQDMAGDWIFTRTEYDHLGRVSRTSEPYRQGQTILWNENEYDAMGRVIRQTDPSGNNYTMAYSGLTTVTTDPLGRTTTKTLDMEGNLVRSEDALGGTVDYEYDLNGHCTAVTGPRTTIVTEYDKMGHRTRLVDPDLGETTWAYNGFGELVRQSSSGQTTYYSYDELGRLSWETLPDRHIIHSYDSQWKGAVDQVVTTSNDAGGVSYTRDQHGRVKRQTEYIDGKSFVTRFTYNTLNQVEQITYPNGLKVRNVYTATGYLKQVRDADSGALYWQADSTDARGQLERFTLGNGLVTTVAHNAAKGHIERIATAGVQDFTYTFNEVGCLTGRTDNLRSLHEAFAYDDLDRLTGVSLGGTVVQQMTYDAAGNITSKTGVGTQIGYIDGTNRVSYIRGADYVPVQWDEIRYTSFNKVSYVASGTSTLQLSYGWDRQRRLARSTVGGVLTKRYYAGKYYEQEVRGDTVRQTCYLYGSEGLFALVTRRDGQDSVRYCHRDHLGSVIGYSDELGNLIQELSYDAWGRRRDPGTWAYLPTLASAGALDPHGFTGHEHIDLLEMVNMDGRIYDPVLGRFLSPDPLVQAPDFTQSLNRYAYCLNNPLSLTDPSGYSWFSRNWKSLLASVVGIAAAVFTGGTSAGLTVAIVAGAAGGAAGAMVGAILNGQNFGQILKSTFQGALFGAMSGALNFSIGGVSNMVARLAAHSVADGLMEGVQGGNVLHGAMMGLLSAGSGEGMMALGGSLKTGMKVALQSVIGGTLSELGGGNFANGAITAAFSFLFNHAAHKKNQRTASHRDEKSGFVQSGRKSGSIGHYGTEFSARIEYDESNLTIYVGATAYTENVLGTASATVVYSLYLDGENVYNSSISNNAYSITSKQDGRTNVLSGSGVLAKVNTNSYKSVIVKAETRWHVTTALGNNVPHLAIPIANLTVPVINRWEYRIK